MTVPRGSLGVVVRKGPSSFEAHISRTYAVMAVGQQLGFYFYSAGISPSELRVGNIVWDFRQPNHMNSYFHEDILTTRAELFHHESHASLDIEYEAGKSFVGRLGFEGIASIGGDYNKTLKMHIRATKAEIVRVLSHKLQDFGRLILEDQKASNWLSLNLSTALTLGSLVVDVKRKEFLRRPKLWLCTGLLTIEDGSYEVTYKKEKGGSSTLTDPTGTVPVSAELGINRAGASARCTDINQNTIVGAQWMLLYCRNVGNKAGSSSPWQVKLEGKYADGQVKEATVPFMQIVTGAEEIMADLKTDGSDPANEFSDEEDEDVEVTDWFEPTLTKDDTDDYTKFVWYLQKLREDQQKRAPAATASNCQNEAMALE